MINVRRLIGAILVVGMVTTYSFAWGHSCNSGCNSSMYGGCSSYIGGCNSSCSACNSCNFNSSCSSCGQNSGCSSCGKNGCNATTSSIIEPKSIASQSIDLQLSIEEQKLKKIEAMLIEVNLIIAQIKKEHGQIIHPVSASIPIKQSK